MQPLIALVDCNNFYVSCERVFRPDLIGKPVAVLSNNDGCIVARSQEVKDLGIKMAVPLYQVQNLIKQYHVQLFSSNYTLYADMSARVMSILEEFTQHLALKNKVSNPAHYTLQGAGFTPSLEVYSIDEAFLDLTGIAACQQDSIAYGRKIRKTVFRQTGIPVCVGMAPTKTLAKLANHAAKKWKKTGGVVDLSDPVRRQKLLRLVSVKDIWGIGSRTASKLNQSGIESAWDLACQPIKHIQNRFNVLVARTVMELNGIPCLALEEIAPEKQQIVCSRSFSRRLTQYHELCAALSEFCSRAAEKLRNQHSMAGCVTVFIRTNPFNPQKPQYQRIASTKIQPATQDTRIIIAKANTLLKEIYKSGYRYHKCGVELSEIQPESHFVQNDLFRDTESDQPCDNRGLMQVMDQINQRFQNGVTLASTQLSQDWKPRSDRLSRRYTTDWNELVRVKCI